MIYNEYVLNSLPDIYMNNLDDNVYSLRQKENMHDAEYTKPFVFKGEYTLFLIFNYWR